MKFPYVIEEEHAMARVIPEGLLPGDIENDGERLFYMHARELPDPYVVLYSHKYRLPYRNTAAQGKSTGGTGISRDRSGHSDPASEDHDFYGDGEADFIVAHPDFGFITVEVKQGQILFNNGVWHEIKSLADGAQTAKPLEKDPVHQAQKAMYSVLELYKERTGKSFPMSYDYAVCFPECSRLSGQLPASLREDNIILWGDLLDLNAAIQRIFKNWMSKYPAGPERKKEPGRVGEEHIKSEAFTDLIDQVLAPRAKFYSLLDDRIRRFESESSRILTDEQQRILDETEYDAQKIFFGAAGTGKTFIAAEKAKRLRSSGKRVLFTCFNRNLALSLRKDLEAFGPTDPEAQMDGVIVCANFHDFLLNTLRMAGKDLSVPEDFRAQEDFFNKVLPQEGFDFFARADRSWKFDSIIVDEGQDFGEECFVCFEAMLRDPDRGEFYVFADPGQDLFNKNIDYLKKSTKVSKHKLTKNLRNTEKINEWANSFISQELRAKPVLQGGIPVRHRTWSTQEEERKMIEHDIGCLISEGLKPKRITILSPRRRENSCLASKGKIHGINVFNFPEDNSDGIRFATIRSFKGLEADVVLLIDVVHGSPVCTEADIYVGGSRAKFLLFIYAQAASSTN